MATQSGLRGAGRTGWRRISAPVFTSRRLAAWAPSPRARGLVVRASTRRWRLARRQGMTPCCEYSRVSASRSPCQLLDSGMQQAQESPQLHRCPRASPPPSARSSASPPSWRRSCTASPTSWSGTSRDSRARNGGPLFASAALRAGGLPRLAVGKVRVSPWPGVWRIGASAFDLRASRCSRPLSALRSGA